MKKKKNILKATSLKIKGFNFNREEANSRDGKWEKVANKMRGTKSKEIVAYLKKCSDEIRKQPSTTLSITF
jgi:hypothetical protein